MTVRRAAEQTVSLLLVSLLVAFCCRTAAAQQITREAISQSTVGIISGQNGDLSARLVSDLASVLDEGETLRVLSVAGRGGLSDIADLLFLQGMSLAIIPANTFDYAVSNNIYPRARSKLRYISRLYTQAAHLVAGSQITDRSLICTTAKSIVVSKHHQAFVTAQDFVRSHWPAFQAGIYRSALGTRKGQARGVGCDAHPIGTPKPAAR